MAEKVFTETEARMIRIIRSQGVNLDIMALADEFAADCPKWADFIKRLKERASANNREANQLFADLNIKH